MQGDGHLIQVALPVDAGGVDELLVLGHALGRLQVLVEEGADGLEIDVDDAVGLGQQARGLGRRLGAQKDGHGQQNQDRGHDQQRSARASVHAFERSTIHVEPSRMSVTLGAADTVGAGFCATDPAPRTAGHPPTAFRSDGPFFDLRQNLPTRKGLPNGKIGE